MFEILILISIIGIISVISEGIRSRRENQRAKKKWEEFKDRHPGED